jgi:hypothetical protein
MSVDENAPDIDITNIVSTGMKRKLKKKLKRLQGQDLDDDEIFHGLLNVKFTNLTIVHYLAELVD